MKKKNRDALLLRIVRALGQPELNAKIRYAMTDLGRRLLDNGKTMSYQETARNLADLETRAGVDFATPVNGVPPEPAAPDPRQYPVQ